MNLEVLPRSARRRRSAGEAPTGAGGWPRRLAAVAGPAPRDLVVFAVALAFLLLLEVLSVLAPLRNAIVTAHMRAAPVSASGGVVFVAIDARSLDAVGPWPWSRRVHAALIRALLDAGVAEVFLDIDLSAPTDPGADAELARTLARSGGSVVLPAFAQSHGVGVEGTAANLPIQAFREHAWIGSVNLAADRHGLLRHYPHAATIAGKEVHSVASLLSGVFGAVGSEFAINFAIDPSTVPAVSAIAVLNGDVGPELGGRTAVVGSHALEIRDSVSVPVHGVLSGSMIQILATESLAQGLALKAVSRYPAMVVVGVLALALVRWSRGRPRLALALLLGAILAVEALAFWMQSRHAVILPVPVLVLILLAAMFAIAERELGFRRGLLQISRLETSTTERILERVIADSSDAVVVADDQMRVLRVSRSARALLDMREDAGPGSMLEDIVPKEMGDAAREVVAAANGRRPLPTARGSLSLQRPGTTRHVEFTARPSRLWGLHGGRPTRRGGAIVCLTARDVTAEKEHHARMDRLARFDTLTGALNRTEFVDRLASCMSADAEGCSVIVFNLHRLQTINATLGRVVGDSLLVALVRRVNGSRMGLSPVARLGGDRFAVYTTVPTSAAEASRLAERLSRVVGAPFQLGGQSVRIALRAGVAHGAPGDDAETLLGKAELALDEARISQGPGSRTFDQAAFARQARARQVERAHWSALAEEQMHLAYQPIVGLADGRAVGAEALSRWTHPTLGVIPPSEFIAIAEGSGFIEHLGRWVLETACFDAMEWCEDLTVAVNVSPAQFHRSDVVADVERALAVSGLPAERLYLEITESLFIDQSSDFGPTFAGLRALGVSLALDDFGSGFSSFGHLARLPLDKLKVDRMFVEGLDVVDFNQAVIRSVVALSRELGLTLVCEGVETRAQSEALRALGCEQAQGFYFGRPQPQEALLTQFRAGADARCLGQARPRP